jgi:UDP-N-acetylglucosamine acyltransferase
MAAKIHPSAIVDPSVTLGDGVVIGPLAVVEADVVLGDGCWIGPHATVQSGVRMGKGNKIFPHAAVGGDPQDLKYAGEKTFLEMGDSNQVREFVTLNRGTGSEGSEGCTRIGSHNLFMTNSHVAHDCHIGNHVVLANSVAIAGHCSVEDHVVVGGLTGLHQFARIGEGCMAGGMGRFSKDLLPFTMTSGTEEIKVYGLNKIGLKRRGLSKEEFQALEHAMRIYLNPQLNHGDALKELEGLPERTRHIEHLIHFIKTSTRGVYR